MSSSHPSHTGRLQSPSPCEYKTCPAPDAERLCLRLCGSAVPVCYPKTRTTCARGPSGSYREDAQPPPPRRGGQPSYLTHHTCLRGNSLPLIGTENGQETRGRRRKVLQLRRSQDMAAVASALPPGAARPPASPRLNAEPARDGVVSHPARPCLALSPQALTATAASHDSASPALGAEAGVGAAGKQGAHSPSPSPAGWPAGPLTLWLW